MNSLKQQCEESLIEHQLSLEMASDLLQLAITYNATKAKDAAIAFVEK